FRPFTFDVSLIAVDYSLWDLRVWLPRAMRLEGQLRAGVVRVPAAVDVSYRMESVVTAGAASAEEALLERRHFRTRSEALAHLAELMAGDGEPYELDE